MITTTKDIKTNKVSFYQDGLQVFPISISGNIAEFSNGEMIIF